MEKQLITRIMNHRLWLKRNHAIIMSFLDGQPGAQMRDVQRKLQMAYGESDYLFRDVLSAVDAQCSVSSTAGDDLADKYLRTKERIDELTDELAAAKANHDALSETIRNCNDIND